MKRICFILLLLLSIFSLSSCSSYMNRMYRQLDREEQQAEQRRGGPDKFAMYRKNKSAMMNQQLANRPLSSADTKSVQPEIKRQYLPENQVKKRYTADDLNDNSNGGSLWTGENSDASLFSSKKIRQNGDIVQINVMGGLKNEITAELKRTYPPPPAFKKDATKEKTADKNTGAKENTPPAQQEANSEEADTNDGRVYDKISSVIIEDINREHTLLRGRKNVLFNNRKCTVEVQALVPKKAITDDDTVDSSNIIESSVKVLR